MNMKLTPAMARALERAENHLEGKVCPDSVTTARALFKRGFLEATSRYAGTITEAGRSALRLHRGDIDRTAARLMAVNARESLNRILIQARAPGRDLALGADELKALTAAIESLKDLDRHFMGC